MADVDGIYAQAVDKYLAGDISAALKLCQKALAKNQKDDRVLNLYGLVQQALGNNEQSVTFFTKATKANPKNVEALTNLANSYQLQKEYAKSLNLYEQIIKIRPEFAKAYYNAALALVELGDTTLASEFFVKTISLDAGFVDGYINLANLYKKDGDLDAAYDVLQRGRGVAGSVRMDLSLALVLADQKKYEEAMTLAMEAVDKERTPQGLNDLGVIYYIAKRYDEAIRCHLEAIASKPDFADCYSNLANALLDKGDEHLAKGALLKAIALNPNSSDNYVNYGVYAKKACDLSGAKEAFEIALKLNPSNSAAATNLGILCMYEGNYQKGLPLYEKRKKPFIKCSKPLYSGEDLTDKTLFVYHEQGFGDTINFARLLVHPKLLKTKILFLPQKELNDLFEPSALCAKIINIDDVESGSVEFDYHTPLLSLLYFLDISTESVPKNIDFCSKKQAKIDFFTSALASSGGKKIGIAWQGNRDYSGDKERSVTLELFARFLENGHTLVAINKDFDKQEFELFAQNNSVFEFSNELKSFSDTSALLDCLDVVISIDTSVAHLAATKNIKTYILLPKMADWRWGMDAKKTYWYDSVMLCRQDSKGDWTSAIAKIPELL